MDKDPIITYRQQSVEIAMEQLMSPFIDPEYNNLYRYDQETNSNKEIAKIKEFAGRAKGAISKA